MSDVPRRNDGDAPPADQTHGFDANPRTIGAIVIGILLVIFIALNRDDTTIHFIVGDVTMSLWVVIAVTAVLAAAAGFLVGGRRQKRRLRGG